MRIGILGLGSAGLRHARAFRKIAGVRVTGADVDPARRAAAEADGLPAAPSLERLLDEKVDAVVVAVPHALLAGAALRALAAGCHLLLEKPMATTLSDAQRVLAAADASQRHIMVSFVHRFRPDVRAAHDLIRRGTIGRPTLLIDTMTSGASDMPTWVWDPGVAGGGMMFYNGIHQVDRARFLVGEEITTVRADVRTLAYEVKVEDTAAALLTFSSGALGVLVQHKSTASALGGWDSQVFGTLGSLRIRTGEEVQWTVGNTISSVPGTPEDRFLGAATEFVSALREGRPPAPSGADGLAALTVVLKMYAGTQVRQPIR